MKNLSDLLAWTDSRTHGFVVILGGEATPCVPVNWQLNGDLLYRLGNGDRVTKCARPGHWARMQFDVAAGKAVPNFKPVKADR